MSQREAMHVMIVTPLGEGGAGGIDRVVDQLRGADGQRPDLHLDIAVSRGRHFLASLYNLPRVAARIVAGALTRRLDLVHLNLASNSSAGRKLLLSWICRLTRTPYVIHLHGAQFHKFWPSLPHFGQAAIDSLFRHAGAIIVLGDVWRELVVSRVPETADRIFIVPNATQSRPLAVSSGETPNILFLGYLGKRKGVPDLVEALSGLPGDLKWTATIAGDGGVDATAKQARALGIGDRIATPGWVGPEDVERLIDKADILVLPSYDENLPMSVIEGMAAGLAVVATPVGATADVIKHGVTGLMIKPGDVAGLRSALESLVRDPALRRRLGQAAQVLHREKLDAQDYVERLLVPWSYARAHRTDVVQPGRTRSA